MSQFITKSWRCVHIKLWRHYYSFRHTLCIMLHSSLMCTSFHENAPPLIISIAYMFKREFQWESYENFRHSLTVSLWFHWKYFRIRDDTFIILKQNEQRRIINIISEAKAGKNNIITTSTKVVSRNIGSFNIMFILFGERVN